jgi:hypothetical protein
MWAFCDQMQHRSTPGVASSADTHHRVRQGEMAGVLLCLPTSKPNAAVIIAMQCDRPFREAACCFALQALPALLAEICWSTQRVPFPHQFSSIFVTICCWLLVSVLHATAAVLCKSTGHILLPAHSEERSADSLQEVLCRAGSDRNRTGRAPNGCTEAAVKSLNTL